MWRSPANAHEEYRNDQMKDSSDVYQSEADGRTDTDNARIVRELPVQCILRNVEKGDWMKRDICSYVFGAKEDAIERLNHIPQHSIA